MSDFLIFKAAFNNSATPAIGTYSAEGATALFNLNASISPDYYLYNTADGTAVQWFVPTAETTDFEFVADILTRQWTNPVTYFIIADSTGTTRLRMWSQYDNWHFENSDSIDTSGTEYIGVIDPTTSGGFGVFHQFRVRVRKLTASSSSVEIYVDGTLKLTATAGAALVTCAKIGFVGGVNTFGPGTGAGAKNTYVYDLSGGELVDRGVLSEGFNRFIDWNKGIFAAKEDYVPRSGGTVISGTKIARTDATKEMNYCGGTSQDDGAALILAGKNASSNAGSACIKPSNGTNSRFNWMRPDGTWTWNGTACQILSDQRLKQQIAEIDDKLLDAWEDVNLVQFKYNDAVEQKGKDKARLHTGFVVQQIDSACKSHGVDISAYGLYCHEEYPQEVEEVEVEQAGGTKVKEKKVIREASEHYSLRYTEVYAVECMYLRRCIKQLTARIEQLEKGKEQEASK